MVINDVSARDLQFRAGQWLPGKALDTFAPCGPWLMTADEIDDPQDLRITTRVNGEVVQDETTAAMIFPIDEIVAHVSTVLTLEPGDIIATGTPVGVGVKRTPPLFLRDGDLVEVRIDGIGTIANPVVATKSGDIDGGEHGRYTAPAPQ
jgi:2-keto-4-pentenoate hydratase/2-oxohepta-3-ene-1,7-dioic acid hydratase in catechol pathway